MRDNQMFGFAVVPLALSDDSRSAAVVSNCHLVYCERAIDDFKVAYLTLDRDHDPQVAVY